MNAKNKIFQPSMWFILINLLGLVAAIAQTRPIKPLQQYIHRSWTNNEGLPHNSARAIVQTQDGYLWIATQDGLARFNGEGFHVIDKNNTPALKHNDITALIETTDGTLWIGTYNGLTSLKDGVFAYHQTNQEDGIEIIRALAQDRKGNLLIGTMNGGLKIYKDGKISTISRAQGLSSNTVYAIAVDNKDNIWIGTAAGLNVYRHGKLSHYTSKNGLPHEIVRSIYAAADGTVWIGTNGGLVKWKNKFIRTYTTIDGLSHNAIRAIYEDRSGVLWIGTEHGGICQFANGIFTPYSFSDGLLGDMVVAILEDREDILWIGIYNNGLDQFWKGKFLNYTMHEGLSSNGSSSIIQARDGKIWIGSAGAQYFDGKKFTTIDTRKGLPNNGIRSLFEDSHGYIWIGTEDGLVRYQNGKLKTFGKKDGLENLHIRAIKEDLQGHLWVGTIASGVYRLEGGRFVSYRDKGFPAYVIRSIYVDHSGAVWVASNDDVRCWRNGNIIIYTQKDGLPFEPIYEMIEDSAHMLWMGSYGGGLVRFKDGKFTRYTYKDGLLDDVVYELVEDNRGYLWLGGMKGINSVKKQMLVDFADGKIDRIQCTGYTATDGMVTTNCSGNMQSGACETLDGHLWFATNGGIVVVDPNDLQENRLSPPVMIEKIVINKMEYSSHQEIQVAVDEGQVEFQYSGLSYRVPDRVQFRYMLDGFDKEWKSVGTRRAAYYTNLSPGKYIFRVIACNNDGLWNETGANFTFELEPHFYQTSWFYGFMLISIAGMIYGIHRIRIWRLVVRERILKKYVDDAMTKIKILSGLIPICAECKKIRDDKGYWNQLEAYINKHSEASFSHGICPECAEKMYGGIFRKLRQKPGEPSSQIFSPDSPKE